MAGGRGLGRRGPFPVSHYSAGVATPASLGNPRRMIRLLEHVAAGNRKPRGLAHAMDLEIGEVQTLLHVAERLSLVRLDPEPWLTTSGLRFVYAGARRRRVLADIVAADDSFAADEGRELRRDDWVALVRGEGVSQAEALRRAAVLRRLVDPVRKKAGPTVTPEQLSLAFALDAARPPERLDLRAGVDDNPDVYLLVLRALLEHGELTSARLRAVLDAAGAADCGIGGYVATAVRRGDATRVGDVLVVTAGAVARRQLAESVVGVALSDPDFRVDVERRVAGAAGDDRRFGSWIRRLFPGQPLSGALERALFGRELRSVPVAGDPGPTWSAPSGPFLAVQNEAGLGVAVPRCLVGLQTGLSGVNRALRAGAGSGTTVCLPTPLDPRVRIHGGLFAPGEVPPRIVPDLVSLRLRAVRTAPAVAFLVALATAHRRGVLSLHAHGARLGVSVRGRPEREVGELVAACLARRGQVAVWGPDGAPWRDLADTAVELGLLTWVEPWLTVDEGFFLRTAVDPEHRVLWDELRPLVDRVEAAALTGNAG